MGFFGNKDSQESVNSDVAVEEDIIKEEVSFVKTPSINLSTLNSLVKIKADIKGGGSLIIGGVYEGNIDIEDTLCIEKDAKVNGKVKAKNVKVSGEFIGEIEASVVEVSATSKFTGIIDANKVFLAGVVNGVVSANSSVEILVSGDIETKELKSQNIKISGKASGNIIASTLLEVTKNGSVTGEIVTKGIKTEQGGSIIGNIQTYDSSLHGIEISYKLEDIVEIEKKHLSDIDSIDISKYSKKEAKRF